MMSPPLTEKSESVDHSCHHDGTVSSSSSSSSSVVPESLLAMAKDARYIAECTHRIQTSIMTLFIPSRDLDSFLPFSELMATILYAVLVVLRKNRTAGMEICGIEYHSTDAQQRWKTIVGTIVSALWVFGMKMAIQSSSIYTAATNNNNYRLLESLSGTNRRLIYERQRLEMIRRAQQHQQSTNSMLSPTTASTGSSSSTTVEVPHSYTAESPQPLGTETTQSLSISSHVQRISRRILQSFHPAVSSSTTSTLNPILESLHGRGDDNNNNANNNNNNNNQHHETIGIWIVKFHLAMYCIYGRYPTIMHRILRQKPLTYESSNHHSLVSRPNTIQMVGMLLLLQTSWSVLVRITQMTIHCWVDTRRRRQQQQAAHVPSTDESQQPQLSVAIRFKGIPAVPVSTTTQATGRTSTTPTLCAICRQDRQYPACSVQCGHVFCWQCLQQWVQSSSHGNDACCPLCRTSCSANDIILLYNYDHGTTTSTATSAMPSHRGEPRGANPR